MSRAGEGAATDIGLLVLDPNAGCSPGPFVSSVDVSFVGEDAAIETGLPPRDAGLCCHFMVFDREGMALLGGGLGAGSAMSETGREGALSRLIEPKPLNSGTTCSIEEMRLAGSSCAMAAIDAEPKGTSGEGEPKAAVVLLGVSRSVLLFLLLLLTLRGVSACFSGEIDLASGSRRQIHCPWSPPTNCPIQCLPLLMLGRLLTFCSSRESLLPSFFNLFFESTNSLVVFFFPPLRQLAH